MYRCGYEIKLVRLIKTSLTFLAEIMLKSAIHYEEIQTQKRKKVVSSLVFNHFNTLLLSIWYKKKSTITISLFFLFPFVRLLGRWAIVNPLNLKVSFSAHTASALNTCHQREPHPDSEDGKDLLTTRLCMLNTCQDCYSKHQSAYDEACKNEKKEAGSSDWESYKCCAFNIEECTVPPIF